MNYYYKKYKKQIDFISLAVLLLFVFGIMGVMVSFLTGWLNKLVFYVRLLGKSDTSMELSFMIFIFAGYIWFQVLTMLLRWGIDYMDSVKGKKK